MSSVIVTVCKVENLRPHPNADKLDLCNVLGWQMCMPKGQCKEGEKVVYFPADTIIPIEWAEKWGVVKYLRGGTRVNKVVLRGEPSFGLAVSLPYTPEAQLWNIGDNVASYFSATKYTPPLRPNCGEGESPHALFEKYTDIENMRNYPDVFIDGEEVVATEKIHGTNCRVGMIEGVEMAGSKDVQRKRPLDSSIASNLYWFPLTLPTVKAAIHGATSLFNAKQVIMYGEVFGGSVQNLHYGVEKGKGFGFRAFNMQVDGRYLNYDEFKTLCESHGVEMVPLVYRGPFSFAKMKELSEGKTLVGGDHIREGIVVLPVTERRDPKLGRVILKYVSDSYLFGKNSDYKDE